MIVRPQSIFANEHTRSFSAYNERRATSLVICSVKTQSISPFLLLVPEEVRGSAMIYIASAILSHCQRHATKEIS